MSQPKIIAWLKPTCGWSNGVRAVLKKYALPFEDRDIIGDPAHYEEMVRRSAQRLSPCVEIDGEMLPDVSGAEVEAWLIERGLIEASDRPTDVPTDTSCSAHRHLHDEVR